jgi:hypothetical protein
MSLAGKNLLKFKKDDLISATDANQIHKILNQVSMTGARVCHHLNDLYLYPQTLPQNKSESLVKEVISQLLES